MIGRIVPIVLILLSLAIFAGYTNPLYTKKVIPTLADIKKYDATLMAAADFNRKEAELANARNVIPADSITRLLAFLPDGVDNVQLILDLNALAAKSGILLSNFDIKSGGGAGAAPTNAAGALPLESSFKTTDSIDVSVRATGTYTAFRTFLDGVQRSLRPMDVVQLSLNDSPTGVYSYDLTFRIYWLH